MDLGFYDAYRYSGGENWKATASYPPLLYQRHLQRHRARLPRVFDHLPNGHEGSHHFLVDDFVTAVTTRTLPGIIAHESARQGGARLRIPDFGDAPRR